MFRELEIGAPSSRTSAVRSSILQTWGEAPLPLLRLDPLAGRREGARLGGQLAAAGSQTHAAL